MIRKCCLIKDNQKITQNKNYSVYFKKNSQRNNKHVKSSSKNKNKVNSKHYKNSCQQQDWKFLLDQIGTIKNKVFKLVNDSSPKLTPRKNDRNSSFKQNKNMSVQLESKKKECEKCHLSAKRASRIQPNYLANINLNCPMSDSVYPMQNSCILSREPLTDYKVYNYPNLNCQRQKQIFNFQTFYEIAPSRILYNQNSSNNQNNFNSHQPNLGQINLVIDNKLGQSQYSNKNTDVEQLSRKIKKLQQKNNYLTQQKIKLQHKLLFEQNQRNQLKKIIFNQDEQSYGSSSKNIKNKNYQIYVSTPKRSRFNQDQISPILRFQLKSENRQNSQNKTPYGALREKIQNSLGSNRKKNKKNIITQSNNSSQESLGKYTLKQNTRNQKSKNKQKPKDKKNENNINKPQTNISSIKTVQKLINQNQSDSESRKDDFNDLLEGYNENEKVFESRKTSKHIYNINENYEKDQISGYNKTNLFFNEKGLQKNQLKRSKLTQREDQINTKKSILIKQDIANMKRSNFPRPVIVQSNVRNFEKLQFENRFSPRITFSRQAFPMNYSVKENKIESSQVAQIHKKADAQKLKMLQIYFERLIQFSRQQKNIDKKNNIRKQMSEIALQIQELRQKIQDQE